MKDSKIALLGVAYRFNSEDTRNSPTLALANYLREAGIRYIMHDPYVKKDDQNLLRFKQDPFFTRDLNEALKGADYVFMCSAHKEYIDRFSEIISFSNVKGLMDGCNIYSARQFEDTNIIYTGIGRGTKKPDNEFINFVFESFMAMEMGLANELNRLIDFYNSNYAFDEYNKVKFSDVQRLAKTCSTGCEIANTGRIQMVPEFNRFKSRLVECAYLSSERLLKK